MKKVKYFSLIAVILLFAIIEIIVPANISYGNNTGQITNGILSVQVTPRRVRLFAGESEDFTTIIRVKGNANIAVTWEIKGDGTIITNDTNSVTYTAPQTIETRKKVTLVATSEADKNKKGKVLIELNPSVIPHITPGSEVDNTITISNFSFSPLNIGVAPGTVITVRNEDDVNHSVTSESRKGIFKKGSVGGISFDTGVFMIPPHPITIPSDAHVGTIIPYFCTVHKDNMATPTGYITIK